MNNYLIIKDSSDGNTPRWIRVVHPSYHLSYDTPVQLLRSVTGKATKQVGPASWRSVTLTARVKNTESGSYITKAQLLALEKTTGTLTLTLFDNTTDIIVMLANEGHIEEQPVIPILDGADSFSYYTLKFEEVL